MKRAMVADIVLGGQEPDATALCASLRRGVRVAPFKAQNMSNNARVVTGGEIGRPVLPGAGCGVAPSRDHNPVLLKPERTPRARWW